MARGIQRTYTKWIEALVTNITPWIGNEILLFSVYNMYTLASTDFLEK